MSNTQQSIQEQIQEQTQEQTQEQDNSNIYDVTHTKFLKRNIKELIQIYINESKDKSRGVLALDFRSQEEGNIQVSYRELDDVPDDIRAIVSENVKNSAYSSVAFFCIIKPDNKCLLFNINLDPNNDKYFNNLNKIN